MSRYARSKKVWLLVAVLGSALLSHFSGSINEYYLQVILFVGINITLAVSLNLINGYTGQFSLGHAGFMAVGAYTASIVTLGVPLPSVTYPEPSNGLLGRLLGALTLVFDHLVNALLWLANSGIAAVHGLPLVLQFVVALVAGGILAALTGLLVGVPSLRLRGDYLAIVTLGFGEIIRVIIQNTDAIGGARGYSGIPNYTTFFWAYSLAAVTIYVVVSLIDSTYGRGFLTVRDDEVAAEAMGVDTTKYKVVAFVLGAFFAGIGGGLYAHTTTYINPAGFDFQRSIEIVIIVILGGMGSTMGVAFAAVLLTVLAEYLRFVAGYTFLPMWLRQLAANRTIIYALVLIALMLLRPQGLFGGLRAFGGSASRKVPKAA